MQTAYTHRAKTNICFKVPGCPPCFQLPPLCAQPICQTAPKTCRRVFLTFTIPGEPEQAAGGHQRSTDREAGWGRGRTFYPFWGSCPASICVLSSPEHCPFGVCIRGHGCGSRPLGGQERVLCLSLIGLSAPPLPGGRRRCSKLQHSWHSLPLLGDLSHS